MDDKYRDAVNLPYPYKKTRSEMSLHDRAAQFAPFAALTGFDDELAETSRVTDEKIEISDEMQKIIGNRLLILEQNKETSPIGVFTYFTPDYVKAGGKYIVKSGVIKKTDFFGRTILLTDGTVIPIDDIYSVDSVLFGENEL